MHIFELKCWKTFLKTFQEPTTQKFIKIFNANYNFTRNLHRNFLSITAKYKNFSRLNLNWIDSTLNFFSNFKFLIWIPSIWMFKLNIFSLTPTLDCKWHLAHSSRKWSRYAHNYRHKHRQSVSIEIGSSDKRHSLDLPVYFGPMEWKLNIYSCTL